MALALDAVNVPRFEMGGKRMAKATNRIGSRVCARGVLVATAGALMAWAPPALAQSSGGDDAYLQEIVVTATRRERSIQDIPVAVSAYDEALIENARVTDLRALQQLAPSFSASTGQSSAGATTLSIRAIGTGGDNAGFESAVGVFVDGVYRSRSGIGVAELPEVDRIELLRGPQGTLFGKNTSAGAVSIVTAAPTQAASGYLTGIYGNLGQTEIEGGLSGPVVDDVLAARIDAKYRQRDGYIDDINSGRELNDLDRYFVRAQALWTPTDTLRVRVIADVYETDENCCAGVNSIVGPTAPAVDLVASLAGLTGIVAGEPEGYRVAYTPNRPLTEEVSEQGLSGEFVWQLDGATLTSITAFREFELTRGQDIDFSGMDRAYREGQMTEFRTITQELRLQGERGALDWLVGGFFAREDLAFRDTVRFGAQNAAYIDALFAFNPAAGFELFDTFGPTVPEALGFPLPAPVAGDGQQADDFSIDTTTLALFTHNEIALGKQWSLTLGARYNDEEKDFAAGLDATSPTCDFFLSALPDPGFQAFVAVAPDAVLLSCNPAVNTEFNGSYADIRNEEELTGTTSLSWRASEAALLYAGYSRGYKAGGYNLDRSGFDTIILGGNGAQPEDLEFAEETVDAFEIGAKTDWYGGRLLVNAALYRQDVQNFQNLVFGGTNFFVVNSDIEASGLELETVVRPTEGVSIQAGYAYTDAEYSDAGQLVGTALEGQAGQRLPGTPEHVLTAAGTWDFPIGGTLRGLAHINARWQSATDLDALRQTRNGAYAIVGARVGVSSTAGTWRAELFAENLFDENYNITGFGVPEQPGTVAVYPGLPRFWGVRLRVDF